MACNIETVRKNNINEFMNIFVGNGVHFQRVGNSFIGKPSTKYSMKALEGIVDSNIERTEIEINKKFNNNPKFTQGWINKIKNSDGFTIQFRIPKLLDQAWQMKIARMEEEEQKKASNEITFKEGNQYFFQGETYPTYEDAKNAKESQLGQETNKQIQELIQSGEIYYTDEEGNPCAAKGLRNTTTGTNWKIIEDLKGPSHKMGGIDLSIGPNGVSFKRNNSDIVAAHGLVIAA